MSRLSGRKVILINVLIPPSLTRSQCDHHRSNLSAIVEELERRYLRVPLIWAGNVNVRIGNGPLSAHKALGFDPDSML